MRFIGWRMCSAWRRRIVKPSQSLRVGGPGTSGIMLDNVCSQAPLFAYLLLTFLADMSYKGSRLLRLLHTFRSSKNRIVSPLRVVLWFCNPLGHAEGVEGTQRMAQGMRLETRETCKVCRPCLLAESLLPRSVPRRLPVPKIPTCSPTISHSFVLSPYTQLRS